MFGAILENISTIAITVFFIVMFGVLFKDMRSEKSKSSVFEQSDKEICSLQAKQIELQNKNITCLKKELSDIYQKYNDSIIKDSVVFNDTFKDGEDLQIFVYTPRLINNINTIFIKEMQGVTQTFGESEFITSFYNNPEEMIATSIIQDILNFQEIIDVEKFTDILKAKAVLSKCNN